MDTSLKYFGKKKIRPTSSFNLKSERRDSKPLHNVNEYKVKTGTLQNILNNLNEFQKPPQKREKSTTQYLYSFGRNENQESEILRKARLSRTKKSDSTGDHEIKISTSSIASKLDIDRFLMNFTKQTRKTSAGRNTTHLYEPRKTDYGKITMTMADNETGASDILEDRSPLKRFPSPMGRISIGLTKREKEKEIEKFKQKFTDRQPHKLSFQQDPRKKNSLGKSSRNLSCVNTSTIVDQIHLDAERIENYDIEMRIGHGAFATVKCGKDKLSGIRYAIKVYEKSKMVERHKRVNVRREIEILKKLKHQNIVQLFKVFEDSKNIYLVMELIEGESLQKYTKNTFSKKLSEDDSRFIFKQLVDSVYYIHSLGIVHRDLKLDNILVTKTRKVKLIDFGFAIEVGIGKKLNVFCGTPSFMSPEIISKVEYHGPVADVWALGIVLYYIIVGEFPFRGYNERDLYKKIKSGVYLFPPSISKDGRELIQLLLKPNPKERLKTRDV